MKKRLSKLPWKDIILSALFVIILFYTLPYFGIDTFSIMIVFIGAIIEAIEWLTKFVLPWIVLYWIIRLIKNFETS